MPSPTRGIILAPNTLAASSWRQLSREAQRARLAAASPLEIKAQAGQLAVASGRSVAAELLDLAAAGVITPEQRHAAADAQPDATRGGH